jgi:hypothetical protein
LQSQVSTLGKALDKAMQGREVNASRLRESQMYISPQLIYFSEFRRDKT